MASAALPSRGNQRTCHRFLITTGLDVIRDLRRPSLWRPFSSVCDPQLPSPAESGCRRAQRRAPCLTQLAQLRFRLLRPVGHAHFAVHRHRGGEVLLGLLAIAPAAVKFAEAEVAMGDTRTHAAGLG
jgi:hypothetical protein